LNLSGLNRDSEPDEKPIRDTAEQIAVGPSIGSRAKSTARGRKNWSQQRNLQAKKSLLNFHNPIHRARVIQIGQKSAAQKSLFADDLAARWTGNSIQERRTKNTVALCVTTLYVQLQLGLSGISKHVATWEPSHVTTV
jgi:hypothetical protein